MCNLTVYEIKIKKIKKTLPYSEKMLYNLEWCIIFSTERN